MLILSRKENESVQIGEDVEIKIIQIGKGYVKIGIEAPRSLMILRKELITQIKDENLHSIISSDIKLDNLSQKLKQNK
ncbi:carbon storage regulator CsrA [Campylobacter sp. MIT 97-5078]|uniref:carbon storage regulator CsrA n=1 Tax=Campylobacter sp. MIT 97-5078 TaxID=1548153 RepID=UPI000513E5A4|nr:carbon storage regulator CsrA [Campylobacter sp. MIT 97-5078]KGI55523.1 carbon storage regulator [Campylobacter sp. MIT 97-5078]TQR26979.1 carbon storage regulator [Campylobacter sp. MIT 97-5078]